MKFVFFGGSNFSVYVLDELKTHNILPELIITTPDKPKGRKMMLTPTPIKIWAQNNNIEVINPLSLKNPSTNLGQEMLVKDFLSKQSWDLFLVASYGKIIPKDIFDIPKYKTLNIHPSLLPKYRGASPIQSQILNDEKNIGVTIMQIDEGMDTGPIVAQKTSPLTPLLDAGESGVPGRKQLEKLLAIKGAKLFVQILPEWLEEKIKPVAQDENNAAFCKKIEKEDGELQIDLNNLEKDAYQNLLKIKAFEEWPTAYFFIERSGKKIRIIITDAKLTTNGSTGSPQAKLEILKVIPEGKKEMPFADFLRGQK